MSTVPQERTPLHERKVTVLPDDNSFTEPQPENDGSNFLGLATALAGRKKFLLLMTLAAGVLGIVVALILPKRFTADTRILPPQQQAQSTAALMLASLSSNLGSLASAAGVSIKNPNDLYVGMLKSRPVADALIHRFDLMNVFRAKDMTGARKSLASETQIVSEKDGMISISVEDRDKILATKLANGYVEELRNLTKGLALTEASQRRAFYEEQLRQAKEDLSTAEVAMQQAQTRSGMIQLDAQAKVIIETIGQLRARIAAKRVELQGLRSFATSQNAQVAIAENELAGMEQELSRMEKQTGGADNFDLSLKNVPQAGLEYIRAYREVKYRETLFEILAKQYEIARLDEARDAALIQVVEPAVEPDRKSFPPRTAITLLFAIAGFFAGCLVVRFGQWRAKVQADPGRAAQLEAFRSAVMGK